MYNHRHRHRYYDMIFISTPLTRRWGRTKKTAGLIYVSLCFGNYFPALCDCLCVRMLCGGDERVDILCFMMSLSLFSLCRSPRSLIRSIHQLFECRLCLCGWLRKKSPPDSRRVIRKIKPGAHPSAQTTMIHFEAPNFFTALRMGETVCRKRDGVRGLMSENETQNGPSCGGWNCEGKLFPASFSFLLEEQNLKLILPFLM